MRPFRTSLAVLVPLALAACSDVTSSGLSPDGLEPSRLLLLGCVEFNPPPLGTTFGASVGTPPGSVVFVEAGIPVSVNKFWNPAVVYNDMRIEFPPIAFGAGKTARTKQVNVGFDLTGLAPAPVLVELEWLDLGGVENLIVNGAGPFIGELDAAPPSMGGVNIAKTWTPVPGGDKGKLYLRGPVQKFQVGGQNLWIDRICAYA